MKSSASSQPGRQEKKTAAGTWEGYDFENLPSLSDEQLADFRRVEPEEHEKYARMARLPRGRPRKSEKEKARIVPMRFYERLLIASKAKAAEEGYQSWQKWARRTLEVAAGLRKEGDRRNEPGD